MVNRSDIPELYLIEASQAAPFVETLTRLGAPVTHLARQAGMPLAIVKRGSGVIGERSLWRFLEYAANLFPGENLGYLTALEHPVTHVAQLGGLRMRLAPSLEHILLNFMEDVRGQSTGAVYSLHEDSDSSWFHREPIFRESSASWQAESYVIAFVIQIVRICASESWLPTAVRISSCPEAVPVPVEWESINFSWGHAATEIRIDGDVLTLPPRISYHEVSNRSPRRLDEGLLKESLAGLVDRQIWTGKVGMSFLADELGVSEATCKRRLKKLGFGYSEIVEQRRFHLARQLLSRSDVSIGKIARGLGYKHQANFTRAFRRMAGQSPSEYRGEC